MKNGHGATSVLQNDYLNELNAIFIKTCMSKIIIQKFSYQNKATKIALKNTVIELPVDVDNNIDYKYMETYISAIQKQVIKNVVEWKNKVIETTKNIVDK